MQRKKNDNHLCEYDVYVYLGQLVNGKCFPNQRKNVFDFVKLIKREKNYKGNTYTHVTLYFIDQH